MHPQPEFKSYFGSLRPLNLAVPVPHNVRPGLYAARLSGPLFVCSTKAKVCLRQDLNLAVTVRIVAAGSAPVRAVPLALSDIILQPRR